jgi:transcriptional regulator with XRE-family HTH domain
MDYLIRKYVSYIPFRIGTRETLCMENWRDRANRARKAAGITQERLAESLEMTPGGVQKWLAGKTQPTLEDINRIAVILGVAPAWLTHGLDPDDMLNGISEEARTTLRRFIQAERKEQSPSTLWATLNSIADLSLGANPPREINDHTEARRISDLLERS